ncbi:MAG: hypothetical protein [Wendovervirus sonii]|uniref:Tail fiber protein n=1 Tax=phage Lak_Megaphage_Sonny TaxID=3109229 RepID=A0ABZ0Z574_9CAUD|nr:MAG: hypothetical protein [phage Lak_Megaphage_Sonny]
MLNYLKGCTGQTQIGLLPDIISHNNAAIKNEFEYIFDSSLNRLTKSVYAPTGSVKAHFGEFVNLAVEYISIKNVKSLNDTIQKAIDASITDTLTDISVKMKNVLIDTNNVSAYVHSIKSIVDKAEEDVSLVKSDTLDLSVYVHSIKSIVDKAEEDASIARKDTNDLSVYVHSIKSIVDKAEEDAANAKKDVDDLSVYVHSIEDKISDIEETAKDAYIAADKAITRVDELEEKFDKADIGDIRDTAYKALNNSEDNKQSILDIKTDIDTLNDGISTLNKRVNTQDDNINGLDMKINKLSLKLNDVSTCIDDIKNASFIMTYNNKPYKLSDIVQLIDWKNSISVETITVQSGGLTKTLNVLCINDPTNEILACNAALNQLTGQSSQITNPEDYTDEDINDAMNAMSNLI